MQIQPLTATHWPRLFRLMHQQGFPNVPRHYSDAKRAFAGVHMLGCLEGDVLQVAFLLGADSPQSAFLDVICAPKLHGKWATRRVLASLGAVAFQQLKLSYIWVEPHNPRALRAVLQAGFVPMQQAQRKGVYLLTKQALKYKSRDTDVTLN